MSGAIRFDRLEQLAQILDRAGEEYEREGTNHYKQSMWAHACGSPACALGHWADANPDRWTAGSPYSQPALIEATWTPLYGYSAAMEDFGICFEDAWLIFGPSGCNRAKTAFEAAAFIRKFVANHQCLPGRSVAVVDGP